MTLRRYALFMGDTEVLGAGNSRQELEEWVRGMGAGEIREVEIRVSPDGRISDTFPLGLVVPESVPERNPYEVMAEEMTE